MTSTDTHEPRVWGYDDSVISDRDGRTIHGYVRHETTPGVYEVVDVDDYEEWKVPAEDLRPGPVTFIQKLVECDADPPHGRMWVEIEEHRDYGYPIGCLRCWYEEIQEGHSGCRHSHHGRWRRWKITHRVASRLYWLGAVVSYGVMFDGHCSGCATGFIFRGKRPYILGVLREHWRCLLRGHHWPGEPIGMGLCGKCAPCPECGSTMASCRPGCPEDVNGGIR